MEKELNYVEQQAHGATWAQPHSQAFASLMTSVYVWMTMALGMTALTAMYVASQPALLATLFASRGTVLGIFVAEIVLVMVLTARIHKLSFPMAGLMFALYAILNGAVFSTIFVVYTEESIASTFFVTAGTFGAMSLVGFFVKRDLSTWGRTLLMLLLGLIIASVVNLFVHSSALGWAVSFLGVAVFVGLTAYDTQKIKQLLIEHGGERNATTQKIALLGSLTLYLDFVNLFLYLLRFFGDRK